MNPDKTLSMDHLKANGVNSKGAISKLVSKGKSPMRGFASSLDKKQIDAVSKYVLDQAKTYLVRIPRLFSNFLDWRGAGFLLYSTTYQ